MKVQTSSILCYSKLIMQNKIYDTLFGLLPSKKKTSPSGWISFSGSCCVHNNETQDKKGRAGITGGVDGICYHSF